MIHAYTYATTKNTGNIALQMALYVIAMHVNVETGKTYCGVKTLMAEAKVKSDRTMRNYIAKLEAMGLIKREKRTRTNGGNSTDLIELVGFVDWFRAQRGVVDPAAKATGGSTPNGAPGPPERRQKLPGGSGSPGLPGGSGKLATAPVSNQSLTSMLTLQQGDSAETKKGGTDGGLGEAVPKTPSVLGTPAVLFAIDQPPAQRQHMRFDDPNETFRISEDDRRTIEALGGDVEELFDRAMSRKGRRPIGNVARYMVTIAKNDFKARNGVPMGVVDDIATGNQHQRAAAFGALADSAATADKIKALRGAALPRATPQLLQALGMDNAVEDALVLSHAPADRNSQRAAWGMTDFDRQIEGARRFQALSEHLSKEKT